MNPKGLANIGNNLFKYIILKFRGMTNVTAFRHIVYSTSPVKQNMLTDQVFTRLY